METPERTILVIIPAYNEEKQVGRVVQSVKNVLPAASILVIDDCSADDTGKRAAEAGASVITHSVNLGYGSGLETGYQHAVRRGFDFVVQMDADGQHLAGEIPRILAPALNDEADIVLGSRFLSTATGYRTSPIRRAGQKFFGGIYSLLTRFTITDPTSGFQCLNRKAFGLFAGSSFPDDYPDIDVLLMAHYAGFRVKEVSVAMAERSGGVSMHSGLKPIYYFIKMILSVIIVVLSRRRWKNLVS